MIALTSPDIAKPTVHSPRPQPQIDHVPVQVWGAAPKTGTASFFRVSNGYLLRFHGIADFDLSADGRQLACHPALHADADWEPVYLQQVLPLQRAQQGRAVFHGGAVCAHGYAMAFLGPSGQGKSTLTAACAASGLAFLTDDCLVLSEQDTAILVEPDVSHIRVWEDSYLAINGTQFEKTDVLPHRKPRLLSDPVRLPHHRNPLPLACALLLDVAHSHEIILERLTASDALLAWCANAFVVDQRSQQVLRGTMQRAARLVDAIPTYRLAYPRDYGRLPELVEKVSACLALAVASKEA